MKRKNLPPLLKLEQAARGRGFAHIAGVDEAGRGPLAGPVVAAACIFPEGLFIEGVDDSKKLTRADRECLYAQLTSDDRIEYAVGIVGPAAIDQINILQATYRAMLEALQGLKTRPDFVLVDGNRFCESPWPFETVVKGDSLSLSIAAASIIAKETRDRMMEQFDEEWPEYGFAQHKGYGTQAHLSALKKHGRCPLHRQSFRVEALDG